ncbi:MAG TPA: hypothetical protein VIY72_14180 [Acidimicrobiales bacterium]
MRKLVATHGDGEMTRDWDLTLSTMTDDCVYRFFPYRLQVTGMEAQIALWASFFTEAGPIPCFDRSARLAEGAEVTEYATDDSLLRVMSSSFLAPDGTRPSSTHVTRFDFRDGLVASETLFFDATFMRWTDEVFDERFRSLPGVVQL